MTTPQPSIEPLRFDNGYPKLITGLREQFTTATRNNIPALWQRFVPYLGRIPGQVGNVAYGVIVDPSGGAGEFSYLCGVEVPDASAIPNEFTNIAIPALRCAVFVHPGPVSTMCETIARIFGNWVPQSGQQLAQSGEGVPSCIERYGEKFNPKTMSGDIELWIPVKK